ERNMGWKIAHSLHSKPDDHFSLLFRVHGGRWAVLQLPQADLPAKILFCRESESDRLPSDFKKYVADVHGLRTIVFVCPDQSVSRGSTTGRMGHALLQLQNDKSMRLLDLGSKTGTFFASCNESILADAFSTKFSDSTVPISLNPFEVDAQWNGITTNPVVVPPAAMIRLGTFRAAVLIK
ncbi:MAG: FHA domain-containing protein, partial [Bdellovibrionales bacterium]